MLFLLISMLAAHAMKDVACQSSLFSQNQLYDAMFYPRSSSCGRLCKVYNAPPSRRTNTCAWVTQLGLQLPGCDSSTDSLSGSDVWLPSDNGYSRNNLASLLSGSRSSVSPFISGSGNSLSSFLSRSGNSLSSFTSGSGNSLSSLLSGSGNSLSSFTTGSGWNEPSYLEYSAIGVPRSSRQKAFSRSALGSGGLAVFGDYDQNGGYGLGNAIGGSGYGDILAGSDLSSLTGAFSRSAAYNPLGSPLMAGGVRGSFEDSSNLASWEGNGGIGDVTYDANLAAVLGSARRRREPILDISGSQAGSNSEVPLASVGTNDATRMSEGASRSKGESSRKASRKEGARSLFTSPLARLFAGGNEQGSSQGNNWGQ